MLAERGPDGLPVSQGKLKVHEGTHGMVVPGLTLAAVNSRDEVRRWCSTLSLNRAVLTPPTPPPTLIAGAQHHAPGLQVAQDVCNQHE